MVRVDIPDDLFGHLQKLAEPLVDSPADVIRRLLDHFETTQPKSSKMSSPATKKVLSGPPQSNVMGRVPRERGATVQLDGHSIHAVSVRDMYEQVVKFIVDNGHSKQLDKLLPFRTSRHRYLIAKQPKHPNGNEFVIPVRYAGYFMEAHKDYKNAIRHLAGLLRRLGLKFQYLG